MALAACHRPGNNFIESFLNPNLKEPNSAQWVVKSRQIHSHTGSLQKVETSGNAGRAGGECIHSLINESRQPGHHRPRFPFPEPQFMSPFVKRSQSPNVLFSDRLYLWFYLNNSGTQSNILVQKCPCSSLLVLSCFFLSQSPDPSLYLRLLEHKQPQAVSMMHPQHKREAGEKK